MRPKANNIVALDELANLIEADRKAGKTIVLANGAFDLLHVGHIRYLHDAAQQADILVAALCVVDFAFAFSELDVRSIISVLKPEVHAKGTDYTEESVPERDEVMVYGGRVAICGDPKNHSTSDILTNLKSD